MSEPLEIHLQDFEEWLKQETAPIIEPLEAEGKNLLRDVEGKLGDLRAACEKLSEDAEKEVQKGSRKTYRRSRMAYKFASKVLDTIDDATFPDEVSFESLQSSSENLEKILATIEQERARWFPRISPFFIIDRRRVDVALKRLIDSIKEFRSFSSVKFKDAKTVQESFLMTNEIRNLLNGLDKTEEHKKTVEARLKIIEKRMASNLQKSDQIQRGTEVVELDQLKSKIEELEKEVKHTLRYLQKPFLKFQNLVLGPGYPLPVNEAKKLNEYLSTPFKAFATEKEGYPILKEILRKMEDAIAQEKLKLKPRRLRKAKKQINDIFRKEALTTLQQRCTEVHSQRLRLSKSDEIAIFQDKLARVKDNLGKLQKQKKIQDSRSVTLDEKTQKIREKIESHRNELEEIASELTGKNIQLIIGQS